MTIYAAFAEMDGLYLGQTSTPTGVPVADTASAESGVARGGFYIVTGGYATHRLGVSLEEFWVHIRLTSVNQGIANLLQVVQTGTSQILLSLKSPSSVPDQYSFVLPVVGETSYTIGTGDPAVIDFHVKISETGYVRSYFNGVASSYYEGDTRFLSGENTIDRLYLSTRYEGMSQIIVSDEPTTFARVYTLPLTADTPFDWEGTPSNITGTSFSTNEAALVSGTADDVALFTAQTMPAINTDLYEIAAVVMSVNATTQETLDQNRLDFVARGSGEVTEFGSPQVLDPEAFDHHLFIAETDFVNGGAWTVEKVNALKYGFKSKA